MSRLLRRTAGPELAGSRLDHALQAWLDAAVGGLSRAKVRTLIVAGAVTLDGRRERGAGRRLLGGERIVVRLQIARLRSRSASAGFVLGPEDVLFQDASLIAVRKPPGLPTHATADPARHHLVAAVRGLLGEGAYLGVHQRLDRDTSGVVVFSRTPPAAAGLARQFESRAVAKLYSALTARPARLPPRRWTESGSLAPRQAGRLPGVRVVARGGQAAETDFERLAAYREGLLLAARARTGRKHQIRAHLAAAGLPILGDRLYGGPTRLAGCEIPRPMLHAEEIRLLHPESGAPLRLRCDPPADFQAVMRALGPAVG